MIYRRSIILEMGVMGNIIKGIVWEFGIAIFCSMVVYVAEGAGGLDETSLNRIGVLFWVVLAGVTVKMVFRRRLGNYWVLPSLLVPYLFFPIILAMQGKTVTPKRPDLG